MSEKTVIKKATKQLVYHKLLGALAEIRIGTNEKKFTKKLKKFSRILGEDISEVLIKTIPAKEKTGKMKDVDSKDLTNAKKIKKSKSLKALKPKKEKKEFLIESGEQPKAESEGS